MRFLSLKDYLSDLADAVFITSFSEISSEQRWYLLWIYTWGPREGKETPPGSYLSLIPDFARADPAK